jgi:hypothetical protein
MLIGVPVRRSEKMIDLVKKAYLFYCWAVPGLAMVDSIISHGWEMVVAKTCFYHVGILWSIRIQGLLPSVASFIFVFFSPQNHCLHFWPTK